MSGEGYFCASHLKSKLTVPAQPLEHRPVAERAESFLFSVWGRRGRLPVVHTQ